MVQENINTKLRIARDKIAEIYNSQATDDSPDNGNLTALNEIILKINEAMRRFA